MSAICKVGFESFDNTFSYMFCEQSRCITKDNASVNFTSPEWIEYNKTVCDAAESCKKACGLATNFLSCVTETFCTNATSAVKEMGQRVYELHKASEKATAMSVLPWALGMAIGGFALGCAIDSFAPKNRVFAKASYGVSIAGTIGLAYVHSKLS